MFIHSPAYGHSCCLQVWAVTNKAPMDIHVQNFVCSCDLFSLGKVPRNGMGDQMLQFVCSRKREHFIHLEDSLPSCGFFLPMHMLIVFQLKIQRVMPLVNSTAL